MATTIPGGRRLRDAIAGLGIGLVVVAAALVPAVTAGVGGTTTVRGQVLSGGAPVAFYPVGFWAPAVDESRSRVYAPTSTDANGRFSMELPDGVDGFAYAGSRPDSLDAVTTQNGRTLVRGIIGLEIAKGYSHPLYQGWSSATAKNLGGGHDLDFDLQPAGRVSGTAPSVAGARVPMRLQRLDGSTVASLTLSRSGGFTSPPVAPGDYEVVAAARAPYIAAATPVTVTAGRTVAVRAAAPVQGAVLSGRVTVAGSAEKDLPILLLQDGEQIARTSTSSTGTYSFAGLAAGTYTVDYGLTAVSATTGGTDGGSAPVVTPGASPSTTATASATPSATPSAAAGSIVPIERSSDTALPAAEQVTVGDALDPVLQDEDLDAAASVSGSIAGASGVTVHVLAQSTTTRQVVRSTTTTSGSYRLGGLTPGTRYRIVAVDDPADPSQSLRAGTTVTARTAGTTADLALTTPAVVLSGTVSGATGGTVEVGDEHGLLRTASIAKDGSYQVTGLTAGAWPVQVDAADRSPSTPQLVDLTASTQLGLSTGPRPATYKGWFIASGAGVPRVTGRAVDEDGDVATFGPDTSDGHVTVGSLVPGTYAYDESSFIGTAPALDGPWWYAAPLGGFTLRDGGSTSVVVQLHVLAH